MKSTSRTRLATILLGQMALLGTGYAQVTWDAGGGSSTNTSLNLNWGNNTVPTFGSNVQALFNVAGGATATVDNNMIFGPLATPTPAFAFSSNFTLNDGGGSLVLYGSNSGATQVLRSNSGAANVTINLPVRVFAPATASPLGNLLVINVNNTNAALTALNINNGISLAAGSANGTYDIRFGNGSGGGTGAAARIAGTVSGLGTVANANNVWNGKLIFAGNQTLSSSNITISSGSGYVNPNANGTLQLGETSADSQTWNNVTLNNVMTVAVGGNISINVIAGNNTAKVVGTGATGATLRITSGTLNATNIAVGGSTTAEKTLDIIKQNAGTLTVSGAHTYTGSTAVNGGILVLGSGATLATSGITVNNGGTLSNNSTAITAPLTVNAGGTLGGEGSSGALAFGAGTSTFNFDPSTPGAFTASSYSSNSSALVLLTPTGATSIGNTYLVLASTAGFGGSVPSEFAASARGTLALAGGNTQINFTPTAAASLVWKGNVNGNWDVVNSQNWTNGGSADRFYANDSVSFDDTASSGAITVASSGVSAAAVSFDNSSQVYTLGGTGAITSVAALTKSGSGNVTIGNTVSAAGVTVTGGTLALNGAATLGASDITVGTGTLNLNVANTATGNITLNSGGTLNANNSSNSTLGGLGSFAAARTVTLNGGALNYNGAGTFSTDNLNLSVTGSSSIGVGNSSVTFRTGGTFSGSGDLAITGSGVVALGRNSANSTFGSGYSGNISVGNGSTLSLRNEQSLGNTTGGTTVQSGGTLMMDPFSQTSVTFAAETIAFQGNSTLSNRLNGQTSLANTLTGAISTAGTLRVNTLGGNSTVTSATLTFDGAIGGAGGVTFGGASTVPSITAVANGLYILNASNTYAGPTTVLSGSTVRLGASNRISDSSTLVLGGGTFDLAGFSETFGGLDLDASATIALGASNSISFGSSASLDWSAYTLNFTSVGGGLVANAVRFGTSSSGLTSLQLSQITVDGIGGYSLDANGFLTAIPEPSAFGAFAGLGALGLSAMRRRRRV